MNLLIFLSNRCNMSCDYCFLDLNRGPAAVLSPKAGRRAILDHLRRPGAQFTFLGGEPLIHYPTLLELAGFIRSRGPAGIRVVTNGTLLDSEKLARLRALGAEISVSLDGSAAAHGRHRRILKDPWDCALSEVLRRIGPEDRQGLNVSMVLREDTAGLLLNGVEFLRREGFRRLSFHLDVLEEWSEAGLATLRASLEGLSRYLRTLAKAEPAGLKLDRLLALVSAPPDCRNADHPYEDLVLGADGRYYPCDGLFARPYGELGAWTAGDCENGVDWGLRESFHERARRFIHERLGGPRGHCPRETYFHALASGRDPDCAVRGFHRADAAFRRALSEALCPA
ncbi:MAG: radical SAM protein [Elusimicrobia bacterium]|nr:radical SAM protein [Elusimicrobiota bacterium]